MKDEDAAQLFFELENVRHGMMAARTALARLAEEGRIDPTASVVMRATLDTIEARICTVDAYVANARARSVSDG